MIGLYVFLSYIFIMTIAIIGVKAHWKMSGASPTDWGYDNRIMLSILWPLGLLALVCLFVFVGYDTVTSKIASFFVVYKHNKIHSGKPVYRSPSDKT